MKSLSLGEVLSQIEFELAQGLVARPELRRAVRELRAFHEKTRAEVFGEDGDRARIDVREALGRQFQINDMILAVLAEAADAAHEARTGARRVEAYVREALDDSIGSASLAAAGAEPPGVAVEDRLARTQRPTAAWDGSHAALEADEEEDDGRAAAEIEDTMRPERLWLAMDPRAPRLPLLGTVLRRFRTALHTRVLIYTGQLGEKQAAVNRTLGDHLLRLREVVRAQQSTLDAIRLRLRRLEARFAARGRDGDG